MHTRTHHYIHAHMHARLNARTHAHTHACTHARTDGRTNTSTQIKRKTPSLQLNTTHCTALQYTTRRCNTLQHIAIRCNTIHNHIRILTRSAFLHQSKAAHLLATTAVLQHAATPCQLPGCNTLQHHTHHSLLDVRFRNFAFICPRQRICWR